MSKVQTTTSPDNIQRLQVLLLIFFFVFYLPNPIDWLGNAMTSSAIRNLGAANRQPSSFSLHLLVVCFVYAREKVKLTVLICLCVDKYISQFFKFILQFNVEFYFCPGEDIQRGVWFEFD